MDWLVHGVHLLFVVIAVGGTLTLRFIVLPNLGDDTPGAAIKGSILFRWRPVVWLSIVMIIVTGLANVHFAYQEVGRDFLYWMIFAGKVACALILFTLALTLTLPLRNLARVQEKRSRWLAYIVGLGVLILFLSSALRHLHDAAPKP
jgi:uncharacterized membrane protein